VRANALLDGARAAATDIARALSHDLELPRPVSDLVAGWAAFAGLVNTPDLAPSARALFKVCSTKLDISHRAFLAAAEAVTSTFPTPTAGLTFWKKNLLGPARHYAIDYIIRHHPGDPQLAPALTGLFVGVLEGFTTADAELLLADAVEARTGIAESEAAAAAAEEFILAVLGPIPALHRQRLRERLIARTFSRPWADILQRADERARTDLAPSPELVEMLTAQQVLVGDFSANAPHPPELREAVSDYLNKDEVSDLIGISKAGVIEAREFNYPLGLSKYNKRPEKFLESLKRLRLAADGVFGGEFVVPNRNTISDLDSRFAHNAKVLLLLGFFYRTKARRRDRWQVIPLGHQRAFGMVIPDPLLRKVYGVDFSEIDAANFEPPTGPLSSALLKMARAADGVRVGGATWSTASTIKFLKPIIRELNAVKGSILCRPGFVMSDLLVEMFQSSAKGDLVPDIHTLLTRHPDQNVKDESKLDIFPEFSHANEVQEDFDEARLLDRCALFDLGHKRVIDDVVKKEECRENYNILIVNHGLEVPLGVGFSLPLLPALMRRGRWSRGTSESYLYEEIRARAIEAFVKSDTEDRIEKFLELGIDLLELRDGSGTVVDISKARRAAPLRKL